MQHNVFVVVVVVCVVLVLAAATAAAGPSQAYPVLAIASCLVGKQPEATGKVGGRFINAINA